MEISKPEDSGFTIYSKSGCGNCVKLKSLLREKGFLFQVIDCDEYLLEDKPKFLRYIHLLVGKEYKTFPIVFLNGSFMGGYKETEEYLTNFGKNNLLDFNSDF